MAVCSDINNGTITLERTFTLRIRAYYIKLVIRRGLLCKQNHKGLKIDTLIQSK